MRENEGIYGNYDIRLHFMESASKLLYICTTSVEVVLDRIIPSSHTSLCFVPFAE